MDHIAHVKQQENGEWDIHTLTDHALGTATKAQGYAEPFNSAE